LPGVPVADTLKRVGPDGVILETVPRQGVVAVQTPQAFRRDWLVQAYANRGRLREPITDDAQLVEALGHSCRVVEGSRFNLKITTPEDLHLAGAMLHALPKPRRDGPAHPFADERTKWGGPPEPPSEGPFR